MSEPIKVGDLVVVVGSHCGGSALGIIRTVIEIKTNYYGQCSKCGFRQVHSVVGVLDGPAPWSLWHVPLPWLRRIPPLAELDEVERDESIPA